jgi:hypothetical protein
MIRYGAPFPGAERTGARLAAMWTQTGPGPDVAELLERIKRADALIATLSECLLEALKKRNGVCEKQ